MYVIFLFLFVLFLGQVNLPIIENQKCEQLFRQTGLRNKFVLHDSFMCAGGIEGRDACKGDGGGPLVCPSKDDPNRYSSCHLVVAKLFLAAIQS